MGYAVKLQSAASRYLYISDQMDSNYDRGATPLNPKYPYRYWVYAGYPNISSAASYIGLNDSDCPRIYFGDQGNSYGMKVFKINDEITTLPKWILPSNANNGIGSHLFQFKKPIQQISLLVRGDSSGPKTFSLTAGTFVFACQFGTNDGNPPTQYGKIVYPQQYPDENDLHGQCGGVYAIGAAYGFIYKNDTGWMCKSQGSWQNGVYQFSF